MNNTRSLSINKLLLFIILIISSLFIGPWLSIASAATQSSSPQVILNGIKLDFEVLPIIENSRTMVPLRSIFEAMGADVYWDDTSRVVTASKENITVILPVNSSIALVNGSPYVLDVPAKIVNNRTLAPLRFVGEAFGGRVGWDEKTRIIHIDNASVEQPTAVKINVNRINIRSGPSTLTAIVDRADAGEILEVLAEQDGWFKVNLGNKTGWVAAWLVVASSGEDTSEPQEPQLQKRIVVLDAGHGGVDPGACGETLKEKDINLEITQRVGELLKQKGITVVFTRTDDIYLGLEERSKIANRLNASLFVSIHNNASELSSASGIETYFYAPTSNPDLFAQRGERAKLANAIQTQLVSALLSKNRGVKEKNLSVLRNTLMPSALVEVAFLSNPTEEALLQDNDFIDRAALGIANGIIVFMND